MIFELMSNGTLAKLPQASVPEGITPPEGPFVMLLLPHNRCLVGVPAAGAGDSWSWGKPGGGMSAVSLYENEALTLPLDASTLISLPKDTVAFLRGELLAQMDPPGSHMSTVLALKGFMKDHAAFFDDFPFQDEAAFALCLNDDEVLRKAYWALRFAMARGEYDAVTRLKAWVKAGPELLGDPENEFRIWFSILNLPTESDLQELEALSFSRGDLKHMASQRITPIFLYNQRAGYLVLDRLTRGEFLTWAFLPPALWTELRERRKLPIREVMLALWGQRDVDRALEDRSRYMRGLGGGVSLSRT